ncbi:MAG: hypothetical protein K6T29_01365 [Peptococcaceae bacterium]|nr:hypothetical protein [Peptococcaceae bacterium]
MISWKKVHQWMVKALEEPFFRAEMHRVEMSLPDAGEPQLQLIEGGRRKKGGRGPVEIKGVGRFAARN